MITFTSLSVYLATTVTLPSTDKLISIGLDVPYKIEWSTDLKNWQELHDVEKDAFGNIVIHTLDPQYPHRFFRATPAN